MSEIALFFRYDGEWKQKDEGGAYVWISNNNGRMCNTLITDDPETITLSHLRDRIFNVAPFDRDKTDIRLSYIPMSYPDSGPVIIKCDFGAKCYLLACSEGSKNRSTIHVELIAKQDVNLHDDVGVNECRGFGDTDNDWYSALINEFPIDCAFEVPNPSTTETANNDTYIFTPTPFFLPILYFLNLTTYTNLFSGKV